MKVVTTLSDIEHDKTLHVLTGTDLLTSLSTTNTDYLNEFYAVSLSFTSFMTVQAVLSITYPHHYFSFTNTPVDTIRLD